MKTTIIVFTLLISAQLFAEEHSLHAHEHGAIKVGMAVEKNTVEIDIDGPAQSFLGFEYIPKTNKEKKLLSDLEGQWTKHLDSLIAFDKKLNCKVTEASFKQVIDEKETKEASLKLGSNKEAGVHSDIEAKAKISCIGEVSGSAVTISLRKSFKNIKKLLVEVISNETKSVEITKEVQVFKI